MEEMERRFCEEYIVDLDARAAALRAGYDAEAASAAEGWLRRRGKRYKPEVAALVGALKEARSRRTAVTAERVLLEYARIAFANIADVTDGTQLCEGASADDMAAIASVKIKKGSDCDVKMYDKLKALDMLAKHLGMFGEDGAAASEGMPRIVVHPDGSVTINGDEGG